MPLTMFKQFGYIEQHVSPDGKHSVGECPFCHKPREDGHFLINLQNENKVWDCKHCGRSGGFKKFLQEITTYAKKNLILDPLLILVKNRNLKPETLKVFNVGYLPKVKKYLVPVYDGKGEVCNIKIFDLTGMTSTFRNTAACTSAMFNVKKLIDKKQYDTVYVCEGEWDVMAATEIFPDDVIIGCPGAGTFKTDIIPYLQGKKIYLLYDHDEAGTNGAKKALTLLTSTALRVFILHWEEELPTGFDVRDLLKKVGPEKAKQYILNNCRLEKTDNTVTNTGTGEEPIDCEEVYAVFKKWLHLPSTDIIDIIFGTIIANRYAGDPLWMFIVAPPGFNKTEPLLSLTGAKGIETLSSLTPATLISGANTSMGDPSLIPRLNNKILIIKDFTGTLGLPITEREEIFAILRDAFDGECSKPFGNGITRKYKSKFGILAAVTPIIERYLEDNASLGERFLQWHNKIPTGVDVRGVYIRRALGNVTKEVQMREDLQRVAARVLNSSYPEVLPDLSPAIEEQLIALAQWIALMRGNVARDKFTKDITHRPFTELGTRLVKQLCKMVSGVSLFHRSRVIDARSMALLRHVARSSVPGRYDDIVEAIYKNNVTDVKDIAPYSGLSKTVCTQMLENLASLRVLIKTTSDGNKPVWNLTEDIKQLIQRSEIYAIEPIHQKTNTVTLKFRSKNTNRSN